MITVDAVEITLQPWDGPAASEGSVRAGLPGVLTSEALANVLERMLRRTPALAGLLTGDVTEWLTNLIMRFVERVAQFVRRVGGSASLAVPIGSGLTMTLTI